MNAAEREHLARHCLLNLHEVVALWHRRDWERLLAVVEYTQARIPKEMSKTDPFMYRKLCMGLCEYHIHGFDSFDPAAIRRLALAQQSTGDEARLCT